MGLLPAFPSYNIQIFLNCPSTRHFEIPTKEDGDAAKLFSVPDFVGDACKAIASRIRGSVASVPFDDFHKVSLSIEI